MFQKASARASSSDEFASVGHLVYKRMSLLFLFVYWLVQPLLTPHVFLYLPLLNLSLYSSPSCSFCTTSYDIQAVSIFQCIQFLNEIRRSILDFPLRFFFRGISSVQNANTVNFVFVMMYAHMPSHLTYRQRFMNDVNPRGYRRW